MPPTVWITWCQPEILWGKKQEKILSSGQPHLAEFQWELMWKWEADKGSYGGQGPMHSVDYQVCMPSPLITHFQLLLDHLHLGPSLSLEIQRIDQNWSIWKAELIISSLLHCLSTHPPTSHPIHSHLEILHFHESYHIFLFSVTKTLGSTLVSSSPSPLNPLNQQILIILPTEWLLDCCFSFLLFQTLTKSYTNCFNRS